tara:strand:+ start:201 stop:425 length:225 start_codon:yes stop_codon:yes gene_type:complete
MIENIINLEIELLPDKSKEQVEIYVNKNMKKLFKIEEGKYKVKQFYNNNIDDEIFYSTLIEGGRRVSFKQILIF